MTARKENSVQEMIKYQSGYHFLRRILLSKDEMKKAPFMTSARYEVIMWTGSGYVTLKTFHRLAPALKWLQIDARKALKRRNLDSKGTRAKSLFKRLLAKSIKEKKNER